MNQARTDLDQYSDAYEESFPYAKENNLMMNWYPLRVIERHPCGHALELGLGHGHTTLLFSKHYESLTVLDGSPTIITKFTQKYPDCSAQLVRTYFEEYSPPRLFDVIIAGFVLEHVDDPNFIIQKYAQCLSPQGSLFIAVPNATALNKRLGKAAGLLDDMFKLSPSDLQLGHKRLYSVESLRTLVKDCGLVEVSLEGLLLKPFSTAQLEALQLGENVYRAMLEVGKDFPELSVGLLIQVKHP